jgi:exodeoxyribonuclease-3
VTLEERALTIVSWNADGLRKRTLDFEADIVCVQEARAFAHELPTLPGFACAHSLNAKRRYGVVTYAKSGIARRFDWDEEGRVLLLETDELALFNVYAVNGTTPERHAFKRAFLERLRDEAHRVAKPLILAGDWNVSRSRIDVHPRLRTEPLHALARAQMNDSFIPELGLVDVFRELHPTERAYTWFARSRTLDAARVDYFLISRSLLPRVLEARVLEDRRGSDHAPLTLRLRRRE